MQQRLAGELDFAIVERYSEFVGATYQFNFCWSKRFRYGIKQRLDAVER